MAVFKMSTLATSVALMAALVPVALAYSPYSDIQSTETAEPQEVGTTTIDGSLVYSMNVCTIVQNTQCQISMSTGGAAPSASESTAPSGGESSAPGAGASGSETLYPIPTESPSTPVGGGNPPGSSAESGVPGSPAPGPPTPTVYTTTNAAGIPTTVSSGLPGSGSASATTEGGFTTGGGQGPSTTHKGKPSGTASGAPQTTSPAAGAALVAAPVMALGIAGMAAVYLI